MQTGAMQFFRWLRVVGDTVFSAGVIALVIFIARLATGGSVHRGETWSEDTGGLAAPAE
jgi:nitric oxide reductase subunit B